MFFCVLISVLVALGRLRPIFFVANLPIPQPPSHLLHHPVRIPLPSVLRIGKNRADTVGDSLGYDHPIGRRIVARGDGVFAEGFAGGQNRTTAWVLAERGGVGVGQDPVCQATVFGERERRHEVFTREVLGVREGEAPHGVREGPCFGTFGGVGEGES